MATKSKAFAKNPLVEDGERFDVPVGEAIEICRNRLAGEKGGHHG